MPQRPTKPDSQPLPLVTMARAFRQKYLSTPEQRAELRRNVGSSIVSSIFGAAVMFGVKSLAIAAVSTVTGATTAFTVGAAMAAGAPVAAVVLSVAVVAGLGSGYMRNRHERKALAKANMPVPKFWSRANYKMMTSRGSLLTMGLSALAAGIGAGLVGHFSHPVPACDSHPTTGPSATFNNNCATGQLNTVSPAPIAAVTDPAAALPPEELAAAPTPIADAVHVQEAPAPTSTPVAAHPPAGRVHVTLDAPHPVETTPAPAVLAATEAPAPNPAAALDAAEPVAPAGEAVSQVAVPNATSAAAAPAADTATTVSAPPPVAPPPAESAPPTVMTDPAPVAPVVAAPDTTAEYVGKKVAECDLTERLSAGFNESSIYTLADTTPKPNVFDMSCKVLSETAQKGDYIAINGSADHGVKFSTQATTLWNKLSSVTDEIKTWTTAQLTVRLESDLYGDMAQVKINPPTFSMAQ